MSLDINKFSFAQMTANQDGKTSGSGFSGVYTVFIGMICFFMGVIDKMFISKTPDIMSWSMMAVTVGAGLLGYRKSKEGVIPLNVSTASVIDNKDNTSSSDQQDDTNVDDSNKN